MLPDADNRVTLADETDGLGVKRPKIAFRYDDYARRGFEAARPIQNAIMAALGATQISQLGPIADSAVMGGTTRMGTDAKTSVVDPNLRAHDHANLFIVGSSVLPTITAEVAKLGQAWGEEVWRRALDKLKPALEQNGLKAPNI